MCDKQYDVSDHMKKLFLEKQKQRQAAKAYYQNILYNPHLPPGEGPPFDPAIYRYGGMSAYHFELYKPKFKQYALFLWLGVPILITHWVCQTFRAEEEKLIRSGQVAYSDRKFKRLQ